MENTGNDMILNLWNWFSQTMTIETFIKLCVVYFFIIWASLIIWVIRDVTNRTDSLILQFISILLVLLFTPLGIFLYLLIRPTKTLFERYYEEIEVNLDHLTKSIEGKLKIKEKVSLPCPSCNYPIENTFKFCPNCQEELKHACSKCDKKVSKDWQACPYCGENDPVKKDDDHDCTSKKKKDKKNKKNKKDKDADNSDENSALEEKDKKEKN